MDMNDFFRFNITVFQFVFQQILLLFVLICTYLYFTDPYGIKVNFVLILILTTNILMLISIFLGNSKNKHFNIYFKLKNFFLLSYFIVFFQSPLDYLLKIDFNIKQFYDIYVFNESIIFSILCISLFLLAYYFPSKNKINSNSKYQKTSIKVLSYILTILFLLFVCSLDSSFLSRDAQRLEESGSSFYRIYGYLIRFLHIICIQVIWNTKINSSIKICSFKQYISLYPSNYNIILIIIMVFILYTGSRADFISLVLIHFLGYTLVLNKKVNFLFIIISVVVLGSFLSILKNAGGLKGGGFGNDTFIESFEDSSEYFFKSEKYQSLFPFTKELSGSIYANNILYSAWKSGYSLYGLSLLTSILRIIPAGVSTLMSFTGLDVENFNSSNFATNLSNENYGVGTTCIGDLLINLGFIGCLLFFFFFGKLLSRIDRMFFNNGNLNYYWFIVGFWIMSNIIFLCRGSFFSILSNSLFSIIILCINRNLFKEKQ